VTVSSATAPAAVIGEPYLQITWTDPVTGARGHVVIDRLIGGLAGGGLRMRPGCTVTEVADLARAMTWKEAVAYRPGDRHLPIGGGKGGIDFDPLDPRADDVLARFMEAMRPLLTTCWATGEDLGVRQVDLDRIVERIGLRSTVDAVLSRVVDGADAGLARLDAAFAVVERGVGLGELVGGYGVARAALAALTAGGRQPDMCTAVVQGFGSMGGATARYLTDAGIRVIGIADADGMATNPAGLDVETLLASRDHHGRFDRAALTPGSRLIARDDWRHTPCDLFVPAATSYVVDGELAETLPAAVIAEASNVAVSRDAEVSLARRGVTVVPDFIANLATNAWWWWVLSGDIEPTTAGAFARIDLVMNALVDEALARTASGQPLRSAALAMAAERAAEAEIVVAAGPS
jgi:glutamate dehydrogenase (NAD(P)+)